MKKAEFAELVQEALEQAMEAESVETNRRGVMVVLYDGEQWQLVVEKLRDARDELGGEDDDDDDDDEDDEDDDE